MTTPKLLLITLLGGCTVMVNGKPRKIGGSDEPKAQAAPTPAVNGAPTKQPPAPPPAATQVIAIDPATIGRDPLVIAATGAFDGTWSQVFGRGSNSPDCGSNIPARPIASLDLKQADADLTISISGGGNDGFVVRRGELYWTQCTYRTSETPTMSPIKDGWQPGRYDIYPVNRSSPRQPASFQIELYKPHAPIAWDKVQKLIIGGKLDRPMLVEVATKPGRRAIREEHAGTHCGRIALPALPDLALTIERPVPGLHIRPLPSVVPITLRRETTGTKRDYRACARESDRGQRIANRGTPAYEAESELQFDRDAEGTFGISLGTPDATTETRVTLMVFDSTTKFDQLAVRPFGGEQPTLAQRWIGYQLPQLVIDDLGARHGYAQLERWTRVFAALPKQALVYAKLDYDKDLTHSDDEAFPVKNEPLAVLGASEERVTVMTADGLRYTVKPTHVMLAPDGAAALPAKPRPIGKLDIGKTIGMLPPSAKSLGDAHAKRLDARALCRDRAWAPYGKQLPTYSRPAGVDVIVYKSPRYQQIEDAGEAAMDRQCGTDAQSATLTEALRKRLEPEVDKGRAKLLAEATAHLR